MGELEYFPLRRGPFADGYDVIGGWPVTSWPGNRTNPLTGRPGTHGLAIDLAYAGCAGQEMIAVRDGRLVQSIDGSLTTKGGRWSRLEASNGRTYGYGHASRFAAAPGVDPLKGGTRIVRAGDVIAYVGSTGGSTGAHLHFQPSSGDVVAMLRDAADHDRFAGTTSPVTPLVPLVPTPNVIVPPAPPIPGVPMFPKLVDGQGSVWLVWFVKTPAGKEIPFCKVLVPDDNAIALWRDDYDAEPVGADERLIARLPRLG